MADRRSRDHDRAEDGADDVMSEDFAKERALLAEAGIHPPGASPPRPPTALPPVDAETNLVVRDLARRLDKVETLVYAEVPRDAVLLEAARTGTLREEGVLLLAAARAELQKKDRLYRSCLSQAQQLQGNTRGVVTDLIEWLART